MEGILNIREFAGLSREGADWTEAFRAAVDRAYAAGGGVIFVPAGKYPSGSIRLRSRITLYLESGAQIVFKDDPEEYGTLPEAAGTEGRAGCTHCVYAWREEYVSVKGDGVLNGNGAAWWRAVREKRELKKGRPNLICFRECAHVRVEGVTLINSPSWTVHPLLCTDVTVEGVTIRNPADSPNTDGINPEGCSNVRILGCQVDVGDDCVTLKSGTENSAERRPCENITVANCTLLHGHGGLVIGSEMSGDVRNVTVSNCVFQDTDRGIRVKTRRRRGGVVENIHLGNLVMDRVMCPFVFNMYYSCGEDGKRQYVGDKAAHPVDDGTPCLRNFRISDVTVTGAGAAAGFIYGLPERPVTGVTLSHVSVTMDPAGEPGKPAMMEGLEKMKCAGFFIRNARDIVFDHVRFENVEGKTVDMDETVQMSGTVLRGDGE